MSDATQTPGGAAVAFLRWLRPEGPWTLTTYKPRTSGAGYSRGQEAGVANFVRQWNGKQDLYALLGVPDGIPDRQPKKGEMVGADVLWVDLDPRAPENGPLDDAARAAHYDAERRRIIESLTTNRPIGVPPPSLIIDSGRGCWGLWRLTDRCADPSLVERLNQTLCNLFGAIGDDCWNINRVCRLPGTTNSKTGRRAEILWDMSAPDQTYALDDFPPPISDVSIFAAPDVTVNIAQPTRVADLAELDAWGVSPRVKRIIAQGRDPEGERKDGDDSRSAWLFDALCQLARAGVPDEMMFGILTDPAWGIADSVFRQRDGKRVPNPERYAIKQIESAKARVAQDAATLQIDERTGRPFANQHNIRVALILLGVTVRHDLFQDRLLIDGLPDAGPALSDAAMKRLWLEVETRFRFRPSKEYFWDVVEDAARQNSFHPVCDYLTELEWDGVSRLDTWLTDYGKAEDTPYTRAVGALTLLAAVRRVRQPGCKFDEMPVLESEQGKNKSSALAVLAVREDWFTDDLPLNQDTQRIIERMAGRWIVEAAELKGMRKGDVEHLKAFLSRRVDRARLAYGRLPVEVPRQSVIVGTTNSDRYLRDGTGNRRFWPVKVGEFDLAGLRRDRDQLWAEAAAREAGGASIRLDTSLWGAAADEQDARRVEDPFLDMFRVALGDMCGKIRTADAWTLTGIPEGQRSQDHNARLGDVMRELGWDRTKLRFGGPKPEWAYARGDTAERAQRILVSRAQDGSASAYYESAYQMEVPF